MPTLELEEATRTKEELIDSEGKKLVVCVFDPIGVHALILDFVLRKLLDRIEIFWQASFSRTFIGMGGISEEIHPVPIAMKRPVLLISELEVIPGEYLFGIEMLQNLRRAMGLGDVPLIVISSANCLLKAHGEAGNELGKLKVNQFFIWKDLESKPDEQKRLFDFVAQILGLESKP